MQPCASSCKPETLLPRWPRWPLQSHRPKPRPTPQENPVLSAMTGKATLRVVMGLSLVVTNVHRNRSRQSMPTNSVFSRASDSWRFSRRRWTAAGWTQMRQRHNIPCCKNEGEDSLGLSQLQSPELRLLLHRPCTPLRRRERGPLLATMKNLASRRGLTYASRLLRCRCPSLTTVSNHRSLWWPLLPLLVLVLQLLLLLLHLHGLGHRGRGPHRRPRRTQANLPAPLVSSRARS